MRRQTRAVALQASRDGGQTWQTLRSVVISGLETDDGRDALAYLERQRQSWQTYHGLADSVFRVVPVDSTGRPT